jgi:phospholipid transport system transporter-binding protein
MTRASGALCHEVKLGVHRIALSGVLTMESTGALYRDLKPLSDGCALALDMSGVTQADSSALALMTSLIRQARQKNMHVTVEPLPDALSSAVEVYGLQDFFSSYAA